MNRNGKGSKQRRILQRRLRNLGSENVRKKRARYRRWGKMTPNQRMHARMHGQNQFLPRPSLENK